MPHDLSSNVRSCAGHHSGLVSGRAKLCECLNVCGAIAHVLPWQVVELLQEMQAFSGAEGAGSGGTDAAWAQLLDSVERIKALSEIALPAGANAPRSLEALRLEAQLRGCFNLGWAPLMSCAARCHHLQSKPATVKHCVVPLCSVCSAAVQTPIYNCTGCVCICK